MVSPFDAWAVKWALIGHDLTDALPGVSRMLRPVAEYLGTLPSAEGDAGRRLAPLGDLATCAASRRFVWPNWIVRGSSTCCPRRVRRLKVRQAAIAVKIARTCRTTNIVDLVRREKAAFPSGCKSRPANSVAPAGSYRSGGRGNEAVGAFETNAPLGGAASRQAVTRVNAEQASKELTWEPTRLSHGEGRRR